MIIVSLDAQQMKSADVGEQVKGGKRSLGWKAIWEVSRVYQAELEDPVPRRTTPRPPCYFGSGFCTKIAPDYYLLAASFALQTLPSRLGMR
jgi:hypothetical protein